MLDRHISVTVAAVLHDQSLRMRLEAASGWQLNWRRNAARSLGRVWWQAQKHAALRTSQSAWNGCFSRISPMAIDIILQSTQWWPYLLCTCLSALEPRPACLLGYTSLGVALNNEKLAQ